MKRIIGAALTAALLAAPVPGRANDTAAELRMGGLVFVRSDAIEMEKEDLFISLDEVRVDYVFRSVVDEDVESIIAFPMPDIRADPWSPSALPWPGEDGEWDDNIFDFTVVTDGREIRPELQMRAIAAGIDVTEDLAAVGISPNHLLEETRERIAALPEATRRDWVARGILTVDVFDQGEGMETHYEPVWTLRATYWWRMTFPAGKRINVSHRYVPSVGGTAGLTFAELDGSPGGFNLATYRERYCTDAGFLRAVENAVKRSGEEYPPFFESWVSYVLTTGANWAGPIGEFTLTIDKGSEQNFVSFCGEGVSKIGPTTFRMVKRDFHPERDLDVLFVRRFTNQ